MKIIEPSFKVLTTIDGQELERIEAAARTCYKSEDKITEGSAEKLVRKLIKNEHEAMIEMSTLAVRFICDRGISHELVRMRICSFAQESTRYVDYSKVSDIEVICPIELQTAADERFFIWEDSVEQALRTYNTLRTEYKVSAQIARSVLPTCLKTELVMQTNYREWRHIFKLRTAKAAHPQMRQLMIPLLEELKSRIPIIFDDIIVEG